jgi:xylan 1,4-beta-xylosidase
MKYRNPIIPGFYPDPSICRVGKDYYLVTSTFQYFPGVPIFHSTDLVNWKQIGHCLTRTSQLPLSKVRSSGGIYAPTIRYNNGRFYMVTTNVSYGGNFYVYTDDPSGEWSEPIWVDQGGIDPSLLFDDDGTVYFVSNAGDGKGKSGITLCEIDISTGKKLTESKFIWGGTGGRYPEAPHLYKINNLYYLMIAEGGTEYGHMETIARSKSPWGSFEMCTRNPILTHRDKEVHNIFGTGHADIVEDEDGNWWMVFLAFRNTYGQYHHLGRETFLAPMVWDEEGWPVVNGNGTVELSMETDKLSHEQLQECDIVDDFNKPSLNLCWNFIRNPYEGIWSLEERKGWLRLKGTEINLNDVDSPAFIGRRQQHFNCTVSALIEFFPKENGEEAGLTVFMDENHHYEIAIVWNGDNRKIIVRRTIGTLSAIVAQETIGDGSVFLYIDADEHDYHFAYSIESGSKRVLGYGENRYLSSEVAGGFTGAYFGMFATGNEKECTVPADFDWFKYSINKLEEEN